MPCCRVWTWPGCTPRNNWPLPPYENSAPRWPPYRRGNMEQVRPLTSLSHDELIARIEQYIVVVELRDAEIRELHAANSALLAERDALREALLLARDFVAEALAQERDAYRGH